MGSLRLIVDNRERNLEIIQSLSDSGVELSFAQLPVGDYIVSDRLCVERKTVSDFESSIINGRLFEQADRLKSSFGKPMLVVEGDPAGHRLSANVITGAVIKLYMDCNVQMLRSSSAIETAYMLSRFAEREQTEMGRTPRLAGIKKAYTTYQWQVLILSAVPGIGPSLARNLLRHFRTIRSIASADVDALMDVDKIGRKKAESVYRIINAEFSPDGAEP